MTTKHFLFATSMLTLPLLAAPAFAQSTTSGGIPEIVVTAQRKSESVLAVPMSIQAISGDLLQNSGVRTMTDLQMTTPGFLAADSSGYTQIFIRGVGNNIFVGADPSVATYIDDVPRIFGIMVSNFVNTERVEILKGAQGGLYGRNATGGVINIITHKPDTEKLSVAGHVGGGSFNTFDVAAMVNVPLSDNVAFAVAGQRTIHDGYYKNFGAVRNPYTAANFPTGSFLGTGAQTAAFFNRGVDPQPSYGNGDFWAIDTKLLVKASDNFKAILAVDYNEKQDDMGSQLYDTLPTYQSLVLGGTFQAFGFNAAIPSDFVKGAGPKFTVSSGQKNAVPLIDGGASLTLTYSAPDFDLTSISAYRFNRTSFTQDLSAGSVPVVGVTPTTNNRHVYYQELRAVSTGTGPLSWLGGATYLQSYVYNQVFLSILPPLVENLANSGSKGKVKNWSVYLQAGYDITDDLNLTVSGRYIRETNNAVFTAGPNLGAAGLPVQKKFLPSATISYKIADGTLYARWARGYKAGGINPLVHPATIPANPYQGSLFKGEQMDTFEVGYRASMLDRRLQFTAAAFYNDQKNPQVTEHANPSHPELILAITNAKSARQYGGEAGVTWRVADPLTLGVSGAYLNAKFTDYKITDATLLVPHDASGKVMPNSPKFQLSLSADLDQPISDNLRLVGNLLVTHVDKTIWLYSGDNGVFLPDVGDPGYWLTNARLGVRLADDSIGVSVYANNLFNARYTTFGSSSAAAGNLLNWGVPRIIGAQVDFKF